MGMLYLLSASNIAPFVDDLSQDSFLYADNRDAGLVNDPMGGGGEVAPPSAEELEMMGKLQEMQLARLNAVATTQAQPNPSTGGTMSPASEKLAQDIDGLADETEAALRSLAGTGGGKPPDEGSAQQRSETTRGVRQDEPEGPAIPPNDAGEDGLVSSAVG